MNQRNSQEGFYSRGFTTFLLLFSAVIIFVTGSVLYVTPKGRVANWTGWTMLGLEKEQWGSIHITAALLFVVVAGVHIFFNWKVLMVYIRSRRSQGFRRKKEFAAALAVATLFVAGTLWEVQPFSSVIAVHEEIKDYWERNSVAAPGAHAEDLSLDQFAQQVQMPVEEMLAELDRQGVRIADPGATVGQVAAENGLTPAALCRRVRPGHGQGQGNSGGARDREGGLLGALGFSGVGGHGLGRLTLADYCASEKIEVGVVIAGMKKQGVEATEKMTLRELAGALQMRPREAVDVIKKATQ